MKCNDRHMLVYNHMTSYMEKKAVKLWDLQSVTKYLRLTLVFM